MVDLERLDKRKFPLSYGTRRFRLVLCDSRYAEQGVQLRNDPRLNEFIHHDLLTLEAQEAFLDRELDRPDTFNFAILIEGLFAGLTSLAVRDGTAEYGRFIMPQGKIQRFAPAATLSVLSFGFEVLGVHEVYCRILRENQRGRRFHECMGWIPAPRHGREVDFHGERRTLAAYSVSVEACPGIFKKHRELLSELMVD
jgi:RimJ/RimL family protein N-acetyltransferase